MKHFQHCLEVADECRCDRRRYLIIAAISLPTFGVEYLGGHWTDSSALLSDAFHVLSDFLIYSLAFFVDWVVRDRGWRAHPTRRNGAAITATAILATGMLVVWESCKRLLGTPEIPTPMMLGVAIIGLFGNIGQVLVTEGSEKNATNHSLKAHVVSDLWQSVAVIVSGCLIWLTGWASLDALVSLAIAGKIIYLAVDLFSDLRRQF